ncbi:phosphoribosylaminoimidazolesuccinocarboxamide synthase [Desulfurivibrio alkaliphilus]|uniref:Phosphoribosylaminoimidazole-succinocarboxamide synthase n=1 Tax=Desulfurivibrio alkaliphilus (strain DSM 19089 / UNIQEM U267 / AHT2) TaxID=589865 RepID=D6Z3A4_DESAT|nr:phosphoribosylaminoimidazolesuccinocarboxamide synthase [Desulfurivibrio alkaliphilus]ADH86029.1 phosphoribosylaminoimidazole-succinocarboxamide synthase [Desulfurivibrio alkaliphilus AHT 2]
MSQPLYQTDFADLELVHRGKVRDLYRVDDYLLMVASDRISAYDVVMNEPIPEKGRILTAMSLFWFDFLQDIVPNHLLTAEPANYPAACAPYREQLEGRSMLVKKARPLPVECIVRGYLSGSFWAAYQQHPTVCGFALPAGLKESAQLPEPIFTPSTKAALGTHDENISLAQMEGLLGAELSARVSEVSLALYRKAAAYALSRGIIIADTKFELGLDENDRLILIDEALTPDSSRFWPADQYRPGSPQPSFDKQFLRDYLSSLDWPKNPPPPPLPAEIIEKTAARYREALQRLTAQE